MADNAFSMNQFTERLLGPVDRLVVALTDPARREYAVIGLLFGYVVLWTLYAVLAKASQDIHPDMSEVATWSRELALGYPKHPPLSAWLTAAWFALFPADDWSFYLLAMVVPAVALWLAWRLTAGYLDDSKRVLGLALLMLVPFFNFHAMKFNANTVLLPLWAATTLCFLRSYEQRSAMWAALAGVCAAGAMLGKYWSVILLAGLAIAALADRRRAAYFRSTAPWVTIAAGALAIAPHVVWLMRNDFEPFSYATAVHAGTLWGSLKSAAGYLAGSAGYAALPVLLVFGAIRPGQAVLNDVLWPLAVQRRLVAVSFWAPLLLPALAAPLTGVEVTSLWSMSAWTLLPVVLLSSPLVVLGRQSLLAIVAAAIALPVVMVAVAPFIASAIHRAGVAPAMAHSHLLAERVAHEWRSVTGQPLRLVGGEGDLSYGVAFYHPDRPSAFPDFNRSGAPWASWERARRQGIAIVCFANNPTCPLAALAQGLTGPRIEVDIARSYLGVPGKPERYAIILVPPQR